MTLTEITEQVKAKAQDVEPLGYVVKVIFEDGNTFYLDGKGASNEVTTEEREPDTTIKIKQKTFLNLLNGRLDPTIAFMSGRIKVDGKLGVALKLQSLFGK